MAGHLKGLVTEEGRECSQCGTFKPWGEYGRNPRAALTGHYSACKFCRKDAYGGPRTEAEKARVRDQYLQHKYSISLAEYAELLQAQGGKCALCLEPERPRERVARNGVVRVTEVLGVDHDHACPQHQPARACRLCIRGLLCDDCNRLIGFAEAKPVVAVRFADYLVQRPFRAGGR